MTGHEFDVAMAAAKLEKRRALTVASVNRAKRRRVSEYNLRRIKSAQDAVDALKLHPIFIERQHARSEEKKKIKAAGRKRYLERHPDRARESARKAAAAYRKTDAYRRWLESSRVLRTSLKAKYRRAAGATPREELAQRAAESAAARAAKVEARRIAKAAFLGSFTGPPTPSKSMTEGEYYVWRTRNDPDFYAKELDRAQRYKARTRPGYKDSIVKWAAMPPVVKEVKHLQYLISRQIERAEHENHQRAA